MINQRNKQIKKQRRPTLLHLHLHRTTAFERTATTNDEREVVRPQLGVASGRVGVGEAGGGEDGAALHAGLQALLFQREALEVGEVVALGGALG